MNEKDKKAILSLVEKSRDAIVCAVDENGFPSAKAMFLKKHEGLFTLWFSTNTSALRTAMWQQNPKACVYLVDHKGFHGLTLTGEMEVLSDAASKEALWSVGDRIYYPKGVTDPDYSVLRFTAETGNYYHNLKKSFFNQAQWEE